LARLDYDTSLRSLLRPELAQPGGQWSLLLTADPGPDLFLAECARLAYCRFEQDASIAERLREALAHQGYEKLQVFDVAATGTRGFAAYDPRRRLCVVSFRGTQPDEFRDVLIDLQVAVAPWDGRGTVHQGFATAARGILPEVRAWLDAQAADRLRLELTGHSLGAAVAVLAASLWQPDRVALFGCPRVGDADFAASVRALAIDRYCNCCDLVCRIPPESRWYTHVGRCRYIDRLGQRPEHVSGRAIAADQFAARLDYLLRYAWRLGNAGARELADHSMINYLRAFT